MCLFAYVCMHKCVYMCTHVCEYTCAGQSSTSGIILQMPSVLFFETEFLIGLEDAK